MKHDHVNIEEARKQVVSPKAGSPIHTFAANLIHPKQASTSPLSKRRKVAQEALNTSSGKIFPISGFREPCNLFTPSIALYSKYSTSRPEKCISNLSNPSLILKYNSFVPSAPLLIKTQDFITASISNNTWKNYSAALRSFQKFEQSSGCTHNWPLDIGVLRAYTSFALSAGNLSPASVSNYLSAIRYLHLIKGIPAPQILQDELIKMIIRGVKNVKPVNSRTNKRRIVSLPLLQALKDEITTSSWSDFLKTAIWVLFSVAFFASARMGELVSPSRTFYDQSSTLRIRDVLDRGSSVLIHIRRPKSGKQQRGVFVSLSIPS